MSMNVCIFSGRLTRNAEKKTLNNGMACVTFGIAFSTKKKSKSGNSQVVEKSHFINCVVYGNYAEALLPMLKKGQEVTAMTRLNHDRWEKDGKKYSSYTFIVDNLVIQRPPKNSVEKVQPQQEPTAEESFADVEEIPDGFTF